MTGHDPEKTLCYCLGVRYGKVEDTIRAHGCRTVRQVTLLCRAGGGCKSCHPEILELIEAVRAERKRGLLAFLSRLFGKRNVP